MHDSNSWVDVFGLEIIWTNSSNLNYSQRTVSSRTSDGISIEDLTESMRKNGYDLKKGGAIDAINVDGQLVSYDNRRLLAAQNAGNIDVPVNVVDPNSAYPKSVKGKTWIDAFKKRFNDIRNKIEGGVVPDKGLKAKPKCL